MSKAYDYCLQSLDKIKTEHCPTMGLICQPPRYCSTAFDASLREKGFNIHCENVDVAEMFANIDNNDHKYKKEMLIDLQPLADLYKDYPEISLQFGLLSVSPQYIDLVNLWHAAYVLDEIANREPPVGKTIYELPIASLPYNDYFPILILSGVNDETAYADKSELFSDHIAEEKVDAETEKYFTTVQRALFDRLRPMWTFTMVFYVDSNSVMAL